MVERQNTSIRVDKGLWKKARKKAIDREMQISEYLEELLKKDLEKG